MKKFVIILSVILLSWNVGIAQENPGEPPAADTGQSSSAGKGSGTEIVSGTPTAKLGGTTKSGKNQNGNVSKEVSVVSISSTTLSLKEGGISERLTVTIKPDNATNKNVSWSSSNDSIASVSNQGEVTPIKAGNTQITVTTEDGNKTAVCDVTVEADWKLLCQTLTDSISILNEQIQNGNNRRHDIAFNWISIALAAFALVLIALLLVLFILSKKAAKKQKTSSQSLINELNEKMNWIQTEKGGLENRITTLSSKNKELNGEIEKLCAVAYQNQQQQQENNEQQVSPQPQSLYADAIIDGKFNRVKERPDGDTIFELMLSKAGETRAKVIVPESAHTKIIANPSFLEGCEKQILGNTIVTMQRDGIAQKDDSGKWIITTTPEVKIS